MKKLKQILSVIANYSKRFWTWYKGCYIGRPWYIKTVTSIVSLLILFILYLGAVDINLFWLFGMSPGWEEISEHKTSEASELYAADIDPKTGKFKLSRKVLLPKPEGYEERAPRADRRPNNNGDRQNNRGPRRDHQDRPHHNNNRREQE